MSNAATHAAMGIPNPAERAEALKAAKQRRENGGKEEPPLQGDGIFMWAAEPPPELPPVRRIAAWKLRLEAKPGCWARVLGPYTKKHQADNSKHRLVHHDPGKKWDYLSRCFNGQWYIYARYKGKIATR